jgi:hypothetical protein
MAVRLIAAVRSRDGESLLVNLRVRPRTQEVWLMRARAYPPHTAMQNLFVAARTNDHNRTNKDRA